MGKVKKIKEIKEEQRNKLLDILLKIWKTFSS
jgi:hypothetical protein